MKVGLILPNNVWFCPYVKIYTKILDKFDIPYEIISWNRDGKEAGVGIQFYSKRVISGPISRLFSYYQYTTFVKKVILEKRYDRLVVFGPQIGIFLSSFLEERYKGKYIFDYRDLSIEQKKILRNPFCKLLKNSFSNVISSPGFKRCLPNGFQYLLSHNFDIDLVKNHIDKAPLGELNLSNNISVLTIGGIRDYSSNIEVVDALANKENFDLKFVGKGVAAPLIEKYVIDNNIQNVKFEGYYPKEKEAEYILSASFLNIFYPRKISHDTALSNRFYNALIFRKPMIVTSNSIQGDYVEKFKLGISAANCVGLDSKIKEYVANFNSHEFDRNCRELLLQFGGDYEELENSIKRFLD